MSRKLAGTEQYGAIFSTSSLAGDGQSSTALAGIVDPSIAGTNVVGVRGEVTSAGSAGVFGINKAAGPGVQGDTTASMPGSIGVLGTAATGANSGNPSIGIKGLSTGSAVTATTIAGEFVNDNGLPVFATISAAHGSSVSPVAIKASSGLDTSTEIEITNTTAGAKSWRLHTAGVADPLTGSAGSFAIYNQTDNLLPFAVTATAVNSALQVTASGIASTGLTIGNGTLLTKIVVYSQSLTPAAVLANTTAEDTFAVTGLTTSDKIIAINGPLPTAGTFIGGYRASASDQLKILFGNCTAGPLTPAAGTYKIVALRS